MSESTTSILESPQPPLSKPSKETLDQNTQKHSKSKDKKDQSVYDKYKEIMWLTGC